MQPSSRGSVFVVKAPAVELATIGSSVPLRITHELHSKPTAPVIRSVVAWHDRPDSVHRFTAFTNIADPRQAEGFRRLAKQASLAILLYDERLQLAIQKRISNLYQREITEIARLAEKLRRLIPEDEYDFERAKARVVEQMRLQQADRRSQ